MLVHESDGDLLIFYIKKYDKSSIIHKKNKIQNKKGTWRLAANKQLRSSADIPGGQRSPIY
jgi:hypothetical protein